MIENDFKEFEKKVNEWFLSFGWKGNPFTLKISPSIFIGYEAQVKAALRFISERHKIALIAGPTGAGKTSMLKWIEANHPAISLYISKPPAKPEEFVQIFLGSFPVSFLERLLGRKPNLYSLNEYMNRKLDGKQLLILLDESHETNKDVLEWLRVLVDQIDNVSLILAGLPVLEDKVRQTLETFDQRITSRIKLLALTETETSELIRKRIESEGGSGIKPFTEDAVLEIYKKTGGFPREILKLCDKLVNDAIEKNLREIGGKSIGDYKEIREEPVSAIQQPVQNIEELPQKQKRLIESLSQKNWLTPSDLAEQLGGDYKSREHAIRSINNILKRLLDDGLVQRESRGKAFVYSLTPKTKTIMVES